MDAAAILDRLIELAQEAGLRVRVIPASAAREGERLLESGLCRIGGQWWLVLSAGEPIDARIESSVRALRQHVGSAWLDDRYLPPAVRERFDADRDR